MVSPVHCAYCGQHNLTWLLDGTPVCGAHYLETHGKTPDDQVVPRLRSRRRLRISEAAAQLLREAAE
ncbi:MAG TPA: hypothetical protein VFO41_01720 [Alphaproteobacteria bacterium]|nr:hypothetical protein [Alphaproteobacteria bacterium]